MLLLRTLPPIIGAAESLGFVWFIDEVWSWLRFGGGLDLDLVEVWTWLRFGFG